MKRDQITSSLAYKFMERCGYQGISFIVQIILARLLDPSDYGVLTLITIFITISQVFVQSGLNTALIQRKRVEDIDYSSVLYMSLGIATLLYVVLFACAPLISSFYNMPELTKVLRVLALVLIPGAFNSIQNAKIARDMQFKKLLLSSLGAVIVSGAIGISMAYMGFGVWALVGQQLSNQTVLCIIMWFTVKWRPKLLFSIKRVRVLFSFGWKLLCSILLDTIYQNLRSLVIGKKYSSGTLGYYNRGKQFPQLIVENINGSIQSVMLPALSAEQDNKARVKSMMRRSIVTSSYIIFPLMIGLASTARPLVSLLLTDKWLPCVPYLCVYCAIYALMPIHTANLQAINAQGRSDINLKLEIIKKVYGVVVLLITVFWFHSPLAIAVGGVVTGVISSFVNAYPNKRLLNYSYVEQLQDILPGFLLAAIMGAAIYPLSLLPLPSVVVLLIQVSVGISLYILLSKLLRIEAFTYLLNMVKGYINKKAK